MGNPILNAFEELLFFRLQNDKDLLIEDLIELLENWYQLRRYIEDIEKADLAALRKEQQKAGKGNPDVLEKDPSTPLRSAQDDREGLRSAQDDRERKERQAKPQKPEDMLIYTAGSESFKGYGAKLKRECISKLEAVRKAGVSLAYVEKLGGERSRSRS